MSEPVTRAEAAWRREGAAGNPPQAAMMPAAGVTIASEAVTAPRAPAAPMAAFATLPWHTLARDEYRAALRSGALRCGVYLDERLRRDRPTLVFIHGAAAAPNVFGALAAGVRVRANSAVFVWDERARLAPTAEVLRAALTRLGPAATIVAHSMGMLFPAYIGATDPRGLFRHLAAVYLNPLIGGSRYAGDFRALQGLHLGSILQRVFCRPSFLDLAPESEFQQIICAQPDAASSFAARTVLLFTEIRGEEPDIHPRRVPYYFGRTREELLQRFGTTLHLPVAQAHAHVAPLRWPNLVLPIIEKLLDLHDSRRA